MGAGVKPHPCPFFDIETGTCKVTKSKCLAPQYYHNCIVYRTSTNNEGQGQ